MTPPSGIANTFTVKECAISRCVMNAFETEALEEAIRGSHLHATVLGKSDGFSTLGRMMFPEVCLDTAALASPMLFTGGMPRDRLTLIYVRKCPSDGHSFNFSTTHRAGVIGVFAPGAELDAATPAGYANATFSIPVDFLATRMNGSIPDEWLVKGAVLTLPDELRRTMDAFLSDLETWSSSASGGVEETLAAPRIQEELIERFLGDTPALPNDIGTAGRGHLRRRYAMLRRVRAYLREHSSSPVRVDALCEAVGMSRRGLEYLFRDLLGIGVHAFIRQQRLHGARRAILQSDSSPGGVKRIALDWGFWHLGRFSAEYKSQFGELPTATLARRTGAR